MAREEFIYNKIKQLIIKIQQLETKLQKNRENGTDDKIELLNKIDKIRTEIKSIKDEFNKEHDLLKSDFSDIIKSIEKIDISFSNKLDKVATDNNTSLSSLSKYIDDLELACDKGFISFGNALDNVNARIDKIKIPDVDRKINNAIQNFVNKKELKENIKDLESKLKNVVKTKEIVKEITTTEPTFEIGTVETIGSAEEAEVTIDKKDDTYVFNFKIPKGQAVKGAQGKKGEPGTGSNKIFIQQTQPETTETTYMWWETNPDKTLKTLWVETGGA